MTYYWYDTLYQLLYSASPTFPTETFTYDKVGNRLTSAECSDWKYNARNQLTDYCGVSFTYDANGNTITRSDVSGVTRYAYDYENRLRRVDFPNGTYAAYKYDVGGRRIEKDVNGAITRYLYDGATLLAEYDSSGTLLRNYFAGSGDINPSILHANGLTYFQLFDHLSTPRKIMDTSDNVVWDATYRSFGQASVTTERVSNNFRFAGQYFDQESGYHYNYFRYYDTTRGRYNTEDPIGFAGIDMNLYRYTGNDPVNRIDPWGLAPGDNYNTYLDAAYQAHLDYNQKSISDDAEYGVKIYQYTTGPNRGYYSYTEAIKAGEKEVNCGKISLPKSTTGVTTWHSHAAFKKLSDLDFSSGDKKVAVNLSYGTVETPIFLSNPHNEFKVYFPIDDRSYTYPNFPSRLTPDFGW